MSIVFFGNTKFSQITEEVLFTKGVLSLVVTLPDRPLGRKKVLTPNPVKQFAIKNSISLFETEKLDEVLIEKVKTLKPDFLVVVDYGLLLPLSLLSIPKYASLNIHHSLLPKYRGPSPVPTALLQGEKITGVSVIEMSEKMDAGAVVVQKEYEIKPDETTDSLLTALNLLGSQLLLTVLDQYLEGTVVKQKQDERDATYTKKFTKQDGYFDLKNPPSSEKLNQMIHAFSPWPNVWTTTEIKGKEVRIKFLPNQRVQLEGKTPMSIKEFTNGYPELKEKIQKIFVEYG